MTTLILRRLYARDLDRLKTEIELYKEQNNIWHIEETINNSAGNLCLHLIGNLNHYIGATLGNSGYVRNRDKEFADKDIPAGALIEMITNTAIIVDQTLAQLTAAQLDENFPLEVFERTDSTAYILTHLSTHLCYHLGQINYHRRLLDK